MRMGEIRDKKIAEMVRNGLSVEDVAVLYGLSAVTVRKICKKYEPEDLQAVNAPIKYEKRMGRQKPIKDYGVIQCPGCGGWIKPTSGTQIRCKQCAKKIRRARYEAKKNASTKDRKRA